MSVKLHLIFFCFLNNIFFRFLKKYWTEHLRPPPSSELRQAPTSSPIVTGRRCPCPWLNRSSHVQRLASSPTAAAAYLDECLRPPPARCFCSAPTSSPMVSGHPRSHLDLPNLASHSTSSPTVAAANLDELAKGWIRCVPSHGCAMGMAMTIRMEQSSYTEVLHLAASRTNTCTVLKGERLQMETGMIVRTTCILIKSIT